MDEQPGPEDGAKDFFPKARDFGTLRQLTPFGIRCLAQKARTVLHDARAWELFLRSLSMYESTTY